MSLHLDSLEACLSPFLGGFRKELTQKDPRELSLLLWAYVLDLTQGFRYMDPKILLIGIKAFKLHKILQLKLLQGLMHQNGYVHLTIGHDSYGIEKQPSVSIHKNEGSHDEGPKSPSNGSFRSHRSMRHERHEGPRRNMRHKEELRKGPIKGMKHKVPPFLGDGNVDSYLEELPLRGRFVPSFYARDLHNKLQKLYQGFKIVKEYFKEMEVSLVRARVLESQEVTIARFLHDIVKLHHFTSLANLVHKATKVELQFSEVEFSSDGFHRKGDLFMVRRLMSNLVGEDVESQRENIFHFQCLVMEEIFSLIIDEKSCVNVASLRLVEKLEIPTLTHPKPYKLQ
ncbi:hypothetical protein CR513_34405, partial [Mucuna pruriens]